MVIALPKRNRIRVNIGSYRVDLANTILLNRIVKDSSNLTGTVFSFSSYANLKISRYYLDGVNNKI